MPGEEKIAIQLPVNISSPPATSVPKYYPGLDGVRLLAAYGVIITHVAFQTGHVHPIITDRLLGRLDLAVAVFFALSGFLLWTPYTASRSSRTYPSFLRYYIHRTIRIIPAYWVVVATAFIVIPSLHHTGYAVIAANFGMYQIYQPLALVDGLTQMWSLDVEVSFYLLMPLLAILMSTIHSYRLRILIFWVTFCASITWWLLPFPPSSAGVDLHSSLPGYWCWFIIGIILAEIAAHTPQHPPRWIRLYTTTGISLLIIISAYIIAISNWGGMPGLFTPTISQRIVRLICGALIAATIIAKQIFSPGNPRHIWSLSHRLPSSLGRWGYGIFLWHLLALLALMSIMQYFPFQGHFLILVTNTIILATLLGALSYIVIENPTQRITYTHLTPLTTPGHQRAHHHTQPGHPLHHRSSVAGDDLTEKTHRTLVPAQKVPS